MTVLFAVWAVLKKIDWRIIAAVLIAVFAAFALHRWAQNLKEAGRAEVRQQWAESQRRADLKQLAHVADQQQKINAADVALVNAMMDHSEQLTELETALAEERAKNAKSARAGAASIPACNAIPGGVRNALNSIGRTKR